MAFLLDTCVLSEVTRPRPNPHVIAWFNAQAPTTLHTNRSCIAELDRGVAKVAASPERFAAYEDLLRRTEKLKTLFSPRVFLVDERVWQRWSQLMSTGDASGRVRPAIDTLLAATALVHQHTVVTRNVHDFEGLCPIVNPWDPAPP